MDEIVIDNQIAQIDERYIDANKITWSMIKKQKIYALKVDFSCISNDEMKSTLKKLLKIKKRAESKKFEIGIDGISIYVLNYNNTKEQNDFISGLRVILKTNDRERYTYIYKEVCDYLDGFFYGKNYCDFHDNKCGEKRSTNITIGCCRHYKYKLLGPLYGGFVPCEYMKNYKCSVRCLPCKLYTCDYLEKQGIKFRIRDIFLLDTFFNIQQKFTLLTMKFTPEEKIIKRLLNQRYKLI